MMKEFGSDFHSIFSYLASEGKVDFLPSDAMLFADGRQCIITLLNQFNWNRIWVPQYFCYEVVESIRRETKATIVFYEDYPGKANHFSSLKFQKGDVLFRINYFGLRGCFSDSELSIPIIEDHTHDLLGAWAKGSDADWCFASLRKTMPMPEGGVLWSPKGLVLDYSVEDTPENESLCERRWRAMDLKLEYLRGVINNKDIFRKLYLDTENEFESMRVSSLDKRSRAFLSSFDISKWYESKRRNWNLLKGLVRGDFLLLEPESDECNVFSFIMIFKDKNRRDDVRTLLIAESVYPAILWDTPENVSKGTKSFSERMLSVHCDGRYSEDDIRDLASRINRVLAL